MQRCCPDIAYRLKHNPVLSVTRDQANDSLTR